MKREYFNPPPSAISPVQVVATPRVVDIADSPVSTSIDQDAPSTRIPSTQEQEKISNYFSMPADQDLVFQCASAPVSGKACEKHSMQLSEFSIPKGTIDIGLWYLKDSSNTLTPYADADHLCSVKILDKGHLEVTQFLEDKLLASRQTSYQGFAMRNIQLLDQKAWYKKHVFRNAKKYDRGRGSVKVVEFQRISSYQGFAAA
ncbi:hypothetical protein Tco_0853688 [Tanacetum coccineum]